jgi:WD40 repeat protein
VLAVTPEDREFLRRLEQSPPPAPESASFQTGATWTAPPPAPGGYEILGELGRGGMGVVYRARQVGLNRVVALKMILAGGHAGEQELVRFLAEAEAVAALQHPNIVQLFEYGRHDGLPYFTLEFVPGGSLAEKLRPSGCATPLPADQAARLVGQLAEGVQYAHGKGIVHRDLKPANVLLAEDGTPKITDFGLAKRLEGEPGREGEAPAELRATGGLTASGAVMGTPSYMAPEQAGGDRTRVGAAADVYALGAILYECLTGRPPFGAATALDTLLLVVRDEPAPVRSLQPGVARDLETICHKCLHKEPARRYATARELADDLQRFLRNEPVRARPVGLGERVGKWVRRRPVVAALAALVILVAAAGLGGVLWAYGEAVRERNNARDEAEHARRLEEQARQEKTNALKAEAEARRQKGAAERGLANSNIMLAEAAWLEGHFGLAQERLDEVPGDLRRWEWHYLKRATAGGLFTLYGHTKPVLGVCYSPDGRRLATAGSDRTAKVWDARTGQELLTLRGHTNQVSGVCFSPDGRRLATAGSDRTAKVWDARTGQELLTLQGHARDITSVCFSPDGQHLATASRDQTVKVWEAHTGREVLTLEGHEGGVLGVCFSPDGTRLASAGTAFGAGPGEAKVWDVSMSTEGRQAGSTQGQQAGGRHLFDLRGHAGDVTAVCFSPDGQRLATGSRDQTARIWDARTGQQLLSLQGGTNWVEGVCFSPDGQRIAAVVDDTVRVWDVSMSTEGRQAGGQEILALRGHSRGFTSVCFSPDGQRLATGGDDQTAKVWDARPDREVLAVTGHGGPVGSVCFGPPAEGSSGQPGPRLATASGDRTARVWDTRTGQQLLALGGHTDQVNSVCFSPDGRRLATGSTDTTAKVWDADMTREIPGRLGKDIFTLRGHAAPVTGVCFSPDGTRLASSSFDQTARLWDLRTGRELLALEGHTGTVYGVCFSPDGGRLATASHDQTAKVWDGRTAQEVLTFHGHTRPVLGVCYSPDGERLATAGADRTAKVWDARTGRELLTLKGHTDRVTSVCFSADGERLVTAGEDRTAKVWDTRSGQQLLTLRRHAGELTGARFSPDGHRLATAGVDQTARVWDGRPVEELQTLHGHTGQVVDVCFSPDGRRVATASHDQTARVWDAQTGRELLTLKGHGEVVRGVAFSADGRRLITTSWSRTLVWDARTGRPLDEPPPPSAASLSTKDRQAGSTKDRQAGSTKDRQAGSTKDRQAGSTKDRQPGPHSPQGDNPRATGRLFAWVDDNVVRLLRPPDAEELLLRRARTRLDPEWHAGEAKHLEMDRQWPAVAFHLEQALTARPDADDLARLLRALAETVRLWPELSPAWRRLALAQLRAGQEDAYRQTCRRMRQRFRVPGPLPRAAFAFGALPSDPARVALTAALLSHPAAPAGAGLLDRLETVRAAVLRPGTLTEPESWLPLLPGEEKLLRGAVLCRAGKHADAVKQLEALSEPLACLFRALAEQGRGDREAARRALAEAVKQLPPEPIDLSRQTPLSWQQQVEIGALRREVEALLASG